MTKERYNKLFTNLASSSYSTTISLLLKIKKKLKKKTSLQVQKEIKLLENQNLQIPLAISKLINGRRRKGTTINITCIFNSFCLSTSNFLPKFFFHICSRKTSRTTISTRKNLVRHFLVITKCIISEKFTLTQNKKNKPVKILYSNIVKELTFHS